jgi:hypothetical protein
MAYRRHPCRARALVSLSTCAMTHQPQPKPRSSIPAEVEDDSDSDSRNPAHSYHTNIHETMHRIFQHVVVTLLQQSPLPWDH